MLNSGFRLLMCAGLVLLSIPAWAETGNGQKTIAEGVKPILLAGGKAMDCQECAETYCDGDKTCEACEPICKKHGKGKGADAAVEDASAPVPSVVSWSCECDDGSGDGGFSQGDTKKEAIKSCKAMNHGHGKVGACSKHEDEEN